jgi:hypothetical protein
MPFAPYNLIEVFINLIEKMKKIIISFYGNITAGLNEARALVLILPFT